MTREKRYQIIACAAITLMVLAFVFTMARISLARIYNPTDTTTLSPTTLTVTGTINFSSASTFRIPVSASSTITMEGELEIDTTDNALHFKSGGTVYSLAASSSICTGDLASTTIGGAEDILLISRFPRDFVITEVAAMLHINDDGKTATTVGMLFNLQHGTTRVNRAGLWAADKDSNGVTTGTSTPTMFYNGYNDATIARGEQVWFTVSSASSTLHAANVCFIGYTNPY